MENPEKYALEKPAARPSLAYSIRNILFSKDFKEPLASLLLCTAGNLITGTILGAAKGHLELLPALIILIPPAIGMRGSIFASLGSRLGTYLHTGQISPSFGGDVLRQNFNASFVLSITMSFYLGILATFTARAIGLSANLIELMVISLLAGLLSAFFMLVLTIIVAMFSYRHGWDPDNVTTPTITLAGDMITLPILLIVADLVLGASEFSLTVGLSFFVVLMVTSIAIPLLQRSFNHARRIIIESVPFLLFGGLLGIFSGSVLGNQFADIVSIAGVLIMIPAFLEDGGAMGGILAAKFSSALHLGTLSYQRVPPRSAMILFVTMQIIALLVFSIIGIAAYLISTWLGLSTPTWFEMILISVVTGEILVFIVNLVAYYSSMMSYKLGLDPDNITIPTITSLMDLMGTGILIVVLMALGLV
jgi:mgtE-like transporter